ncbi:MAG: hypothetical protein HY521_14850 [Proteobacteria bacterium]|nr:hypothetical protein [Pseudomonadota bacterium]
MIDSIRRLVRRFPEDVGTIRVLFASDPGFARLCREYGAINAEVGRLERSQAGTRDEDGEGLRRLLTSVEEELLARIEGYRPL